MPETFDASLLRYGLLGPLIVTYEGSQVFLPPGGNAEKFLAILLVHGGEYVTVKKLAELIGISEGAVHTIAYRLRNRFKTYDLKLPVNERDRRGYRLEFEPDQLDANRFQDLVKQAQEAIAQGDLEIALKYLDEALSRWRGDDILTGHDYSKFAKILAEELSRQRSRVRLQWCDINLDLDRSWDALPTAERLDE